MKVSRRTKLVIVSVVWIAIVYIAIAVVTFTHTYLGCPSTGNHMFVPDPEPGCHGQRANLVAFVGLAVGALPFVIAAVRHRRRGSYSPHA